MKIDKPIFDSLLGRWLVKPADPPAIHIILSKEEAAQLKSLLDRSLNTLPPHKWPGWAQELSEKLANTDK